MNYIPQVSHYGYVMEVGRITLEGTSEMLFHSDHVHHAYLGMSEEAKRNSERGFSDAWEFKKDLLGHFRLTSNYQDPGSAE